MSERREGGRVPFQPPLAGDEGNGRIDQSVWLLLPASSSASPSLTST